MAELAQVFSFDTKKVHPWRGVAVVPLILLAAIPPDQYWISFTFSALFAWLSDPGGPYLHRLRHLAVFAAIGAVLTVLAFAVADGGWGWVVLATLVVTLAGGLGVKFGAHGFTNGVLLNVWFLIALSVQDAFRAEQVHTSTGGQTVAWLAGSAVTIAYTFVVWLVRGRGSSKQLFADVIPGDTKPIPLTTPVIMFAVIRAVAVAIAVAIAFGLDVPNADWMPVAALVAMRSSLEQSRMVARQRLFGTIIGALVAALLLVAVDNKTAVEVVVVLLGAFAAMIRASSYTWYCATVAALVLIAMDLPNPSDLTAEGRRVLFTFVGVGIAVVVMLLAGLLAKRNPSQTKT
ncbi:FUSC family protein [Kribbella sp. NPDC004138]